jgi:hypothetical protein
MSEMAKESLKTKLKGIISESIEEIKKESTDCIAGDMDEINKIIQAEIKDCELVKGDDGNYSMEGRFVNRLHIRPKSQGIYDVLYIKDDTDRTKKLNLNIEDLKTFVKEILKSKDLNYVKKAYNKVADNTKDKVEKTENPTPFKFVKKEVNDTKNDEKNYNEKAVTKDDDLPDKPLKSVEKIKKQSEHPIKGTKPDYTYPKQKDKKLVIKPKTFKGKARKKD